MSEFDKRKYIRYPAEPNELVTIYYLDESTKKTGQRVGIGQNESFNGCCVVFVGQINFIQGQEVICECRASQGKSQSGLGKKLEDQITKVGFSMIE